MSGSAKVVRAHARPMAPLPTGEPERLARLGGIRAVLFDVYGTLVISASGDVDAVPASRGEAFEGAVRALGAEPPVAGDEAARLLVEAIHDDHARSRARGVEHPEVDILALWRTLQATLGGDLGALDTERLAVEFEVRVNPVWEMPGARALVDRLRDAGLALGIVSNAQFFTLHVIEALLGATPDALGFAADLQVYSFRHGCAKPGRALYDMASAALAERGIAPGETLYVGNDLLNDVAPARAAGFRTALFAGDARSLRLRAGDPRVEGVEPDVVVTELASVARCL